MGMWQSLVRGYDENAAALKAQEYYLGSTKKGRGQDKVLDAVVFVLHADASLKEVKRYDYGDEAIPLLVSEASEGRTSSPKAHAIFDSVEYVCTDGKKHDLWKEVLLSFGEYSQVDQVMTVAAYVKKDTLVHDLKRSGLIVKPKTLVLFEVIDAVGGEFRLWKLPEVYESWFAYRLQNKVRNRIDVISGLTAPEAESHSKKIYNNAGNAKLISANDTDDFTYRGRFNEAEQVVSISYESSQKAHQFLRYLIATRGICCESQVIVSWTSGGGCASALPEPPVSDDGFDFADDSSVDEDPGVALAVNTGIVFADALKKSMLGGKYSDLLKRHPKTSILVLDAATDGRMSVVLYRELDADEYLERVISWHESAAWPFVAFQRSTTGCDGQPRKYVGAPSVDAITIAVFGKPKSASDDGFKKNRMSVREQMIYVIFDGQPVPVDYLKMIFNRLNRPLSFKSGDSFDRGYYSRTLAVFCSLFKQSEQLRRKEKISMKLEPKRRDRSYLYGRLLGAADKLEAHALGKTGVKDRETAALRYMQMFAQRPFTTWETIHRTLVPYIQKVKGSVAHREFEEIHALFSGDDFQNDSALDGFYLLGYYHEIDFIDDCVKDLRDRKNESEVKD